LDHVEVAYHQIDHGLTAFRLPGLPGEHGDACFQEHIDFAVGQIGFGHRRKR